MSHTIVAARKPYDIFKIAESIQWNITSSYPGFIDYEWTKTVDGVGAPAAGSWNTDGTDTILRISTLDGAGQDRSAGLLAVPTGSFLRFIDPNFTDVYSIYQTTGEPIDNTTYIEYPVTLVSQGLSGGPADGTVSTVTTGIDPVNYVITETSFQEGTPEELGVNISPFATDRFVHVPKLIAPIGVESPVVGETVDVYVDDGATISHFECYDGWILYNDGTLAVSTEDLTRTVSRHSKAYITGKLQNLASIQWRTNTGKVQVDTVDPIVPTSTVFPVIHPTLGIDDTDVILTITGRDISNLTVWELSFTIECTWEDETVTIGFINRYGVWEFFEGIGRSIRGVVSAREDYVSYSTGLEKDYIVNGNRLLTVNTGWVGENFDSVLEDLIMSERVVLYDGTENGVDVSLTLEDSNKVFKDDRNEKMINYTINFKTAGKVIPIV